MKKETKQQHNQTNKISLFKETLFLDIYYNTTKKGKYLSDVSFFTERNRAMQSY